MPLNRMKKKGWIVMYIFFMGLCAWDSSAQDTTMTVRDSNPVFSEKFISPIHYKMILAGSFGELRSSHFHGGIDIKSSTGEVGDSLFASMSGYVSRVKVQTGGYGQVLYINHPNGYTTVYAHLEKFQDSIAQLVTAKQYKTKSYEIDLYPEPGRYQYEQGEFIGILGNTGRSYGPHLHFEIRETNTEIPQNPYLFEIGPEDNIPPLMPSIDIHGLDNQFQKIWSSTNELSQSKNGNITTPPSTVEVPAWRAGIAVQTYDRMNGASNKNGIYQLEMYVDDSLHYRHTMNAVGYDVTKFIDAHVDYEEKVKNKRTLIKCYKTPGNPLPFYDTIVNNGEIKLYKAKARKVTIKIKDFVGNTSNYTCYLKRREPQDGEIPEKIFQKYLPQGNDANVQLGSCRFYFPSNAVEKNTYLAYEESVDTSFTFTLNDDYEPLFGYPVVSLPLKGIDSTLYSKAVLIHNGSISYGGTVDKDSLRARMGAFGTYKIKVDTVAPSIEPKRFLENANALPFFRFEIDDNYETKGYARDIKYDVFIDGEWVLASLKSLDHTLIIPLESVPLGRHNLRIRAEDHSGNIANWEREFIK